jgi:stage V sporulation protein R
MWQDIERRWDNPNEYEREVLKRPGGQGKQKIFEVRELDNDVSFLRNYLTQELIEELDMYVYEKRDNQWVITEKNWEKVRDRIVANMTNFGDPYIMVEDGDYKQNGELYLKHYFEGTPLDVGYAEKTLQNVYQLWGRTAHLETQQDTKRILFSYDGRSNTKRVLT